MTKETTSGGRALKLMLYNNEASHKHTDTLQIMLYVTQRQLLIRCKTTIGNGQLYDVYHLS